MEFYKINSFENLNSYRQESFSNFSTGGIGAKILFAIILVFIACLIFFFGAIALAFNLFMWFLDLVVSVIQKIKSLLKL